MFLQNQPIPAHCYKDNTNYDTELHFLGVAALLIVSLLGTIIPNYGTVHLSKKHQKFSLRHFKLIGTGIIISTAFIHLFMSGVILLGGDCVFNLFQSYSSWAAVLAVFGALIAHSLEIMNSSSDVASDIERPLIEIETPSIGNSSLVSLEFGVAFHSVMIGITLGTTSIDFVYLLIAICFHQFFEGLALSSIINEFAYSQRGKKIIMLAFYVISTPLGCLIVSDNILLTNSIRGTMDSLSAGILIYNGFVDLLQPLFSSAEYHQSSGLDKFLDAASLWLGCIIMGVIGIWA